MDQVSLWILVILLVAVLRQVRGGTLGQWAQAKFFNAADPAPEGGFIAQAADRAREIIGGVDYSSFDPATLVDVNGAQLSPRFADKWRPLVAAAAADGVNLTGGGYRSHAAQVALYEKNCKNGRCNPPTARPGTSNHETGDAIDVTMPGSTNAEKRRSREFQWLARHAGTYGVYNLPSEPWHWSINGR